MEKRSQQHRLRGRVSARASDYELNTGDSFGVTFTMDLTPEEFQALWGGPRFVARFVVTHPASPSWWQRFLIRLGFGQ